MNCHQTRHLPCANPEARLQLWTDETRIKNARARAEPCLAACFVGLHAFHHHHPSKLHTDSLIVSQLLGFIELVGERWLIVGHSRAAGQHCCSLHSTVLAVTPRELCVLSDIYAMDDPEFDFVCKHAHTLPPQHRKRILSRRESPCLHLKPLTIAMCGYRLPRV